MRILMTALLVLSVFAVGFGIGGVIALSFPAEQPILETHTVMHRGLSSESVQTAIEPRTENVLNARTTPVEFNYPIERESPRDRIKQDQIHLEQNKVVLDIDNPQWAIFADSNSMDPLLDVETHAIQIVPQSQEEIQRGDVISWEDEYGNVIIHRVIDIQFDETGWKCKTKGDNNRYPDPVWVRFPQVKRVLVALIY